MKQRRRLKRRGVAAVEMALITPLLFFLLVATTDYARVFYYVASLDGCARDGALYGCRSSYDPTSPYASLGAAALADASNIQPPPTITWNNGVDPSGNAFIEVTASYQFHTLVQYPGIPSVLDLQRSVQMPITADYPVGQ
jgi:Flp pilus assembly protein TadG